MPNRQTASRGKIGGVFAGLAVIAAGLVFGWLWALRIEQAFFGEKNNPVGNFSPVPTGRTFLQNEAWLPEGTKGMRLRLFSLRELLITGDNDEPLLEITYKQDGERGWLTFAGDPPVRKPGGVIPPLPEALPADQPVLDFTWTFQPAGTGLTKLTIKEKQAVRPVQLTVPALSVLHFHWPVQKMNDGGVDYGPPIGEVEIVGRNGTPGAETKLRVFRWAAALLVGLGALVGGRRRRHISAKTGAVARSESSRRATPDVWPLIFGTLPLLCAEGLPAILLGVFAGLYAAFWIWFARREKPRNLLSDRLFSVVSWLSMLFYLAVFSLVLGMRHPSYLAWFTVAASALGVLIWPPLWINRRRLAGAPILLGAGLVFTGWLICETVAAERNLYLENRDPAPDLDTWNLTADTDLGTYPPSKRRVNSGGRAVIGWLGSSSTFGSGLATRLDSFPVATAGRFGGAPDFHEQLQRLKSGRSPDLETGDNRILARPGYGALQLFLAQTAPRHRRPLGALVFYFGGNAGLGTGAADYYLAQRRRVEGLPWDDRRRNAALRSTFAHPWQWTVYDALYSDSHILQWLVHRKYLHERSAAARVRPEDLRPETQREMRPSHEAVLWGLAEYCRRNGIRLVLVPELNNRGEWINPWYAELMKRTAERYDHVDFIDLAAKLENRAEVQNWFVDDVHPNELGHQKIADLLWEELQPIIAQVEPYTGPTAVEMADGPTIDELLAYTP